MGKYEYGGEFSINTEEWHKYVKRLEFYFKTNNIDDDIKKKAIMLCVVGSENYKLIRDLTAPDTPSDKTYEQLKCMITQHLKPPPQQHNVIAERYAFNTRNRKPMESVSDYIAELRRLSEFCEYGEMLDDMIRDRLVCGIGNLDIQFKLISEGDGKLTLNDSLVIIKSMEHREHKFKKSLPPQFSDLVSSDNGNKHALLLKTITNKMPVSPKRDKIENSLPLPPIPAILPPPLDGNVNDKSKKKGKIVNGKSFKNDCFRCGNDHRQEDCAYLDEKCFLCKNKGHSIHMCYAIRSAKLKAQNQSQTNGTSPKDKKFDSQQSAVVIVKDCFRCGSRHDVEACIFKDQDCFVCKDKGHSIRMCPLAKTAVLETEHCIEEPNVNIITSSVTSPSANMSRSSHVNKTSSQSQINSGDCVADNCEFGDQHNKTDRCSSTTTIPPDTLSYCSINGEDNITNSQSNSDCFHCGDRCLPESCPFNDINCLQSNCMGCGALSQTRVSPTAMGCGTLSQTRVSPTVNHSNCHPPPYSETNYENAQYTACCHYVETNPQVIWSCKDKNMMQSKEPVRLCHQFA